MNTIPLDVYDRSNIEQFNLDFWVDNELFKPLQYYCKFIQQDLIDNVNSDNYLVVINGKVIPWAVIKEGHKCRVGSIIFEETGYQKVIFVNQWWLTSNPFLHLNKDEIKSLQVYLKSNFPGYKIIFRSLNEKFNPGTCKAMKDSGIRLDFWRDLGLYDPQKPLGRRHRYKLRKDQSLLQQSNLEMTPVENLSDDDWKAIHHIYYDVYINKYGDNLQYSWQWLKLSSLFLKYFIWKHNNKIVAFTSFYQDQNIMTSGGGAVDRSIPLEKGLYRICRLFEYEYVKENGFIFNSGNIKPFKQHRGCLPSPDYEGILA